MKTLFNNQVKSICDLHSKKGRIEQQKFIIEGLKPLKELANSLFKPDAIIIQQGKEADSEITEILTKFSGCQFLLCKDFNRISTLESPEGLMAVCNLPQETDIDRFICAKNNLIALYNINNPGNLGTIIRTARWFGVDGLILISDCADEFAPKTVRSSMGAVLQLPICRIESLDLVINKLPEYYKIGSFVHTEHNYTNISQKKKLLFMGSEAHGLPDSYSKYMNANFLIPAKSEFESLNVAVAAGIMMHQIF